MLMFSADKTARMSINALQLNTYHTVDLGGNKKVAEGEGEKKGGEEDRGMERHQSNSLVWPNFAVLGKWISRLLM